MIHSKNLYRLVRDAFRKNRKWKTTPEDGVLRHLETQGTLLMTRDFVEKEEVFSLKGLDRNDDVLDELTTNEKSPMTLFGMCHNEQARELFLTEYGRLQTGFESPEEEQEFLEAVALLPLLYTKIRNEILDVDIVLTRLM